MKLQHNDLNKCIWQRDLLILFYSIIFFMYGMTNKIGQNIQMHQNWPNITEPQNFRCSLAVHVHVSLQQHHKNESTLIILCQLLVLKLFWCYWRLWLILMVDY